MKNKIAYNNILLTLTQKLYLLNTLDKTVRQTVIKLSVNKLS